MATNEVNFRDQKEIELETIKDEIYQKVYERDAGLCQRPQCRAGGTEKHHKIFRSQGGLDTLENLVLLCQEHHKEAHKDQKWRIYWENWKPKKYVDYVIHEY